ncbi:MAG: hypothetical protein OEZ19_03980 [Paracoccaceae bacterium]|nr:hypothetical protein [Paracoccaceae bacterium]
MAYPDVTLSTDPHNLPPGVTILEDEVVLAGFPRKPIRNSGDLPKCFSRVLADYLIVLNDAMSDDERQKLTAFLGRLAGTRGTREEECARAECLVMLGAKPAAVSALHSVGLHKHADAVAVATTLAELQAAAKAADLAERVIRAAVSSDLASAVASARSARAAAETAAEWMAAAADTAAVSAARAAAAAAVKAVEVLGSSGYDWQQAIDALDAALKIGPQAPPIKPIVAKKGELLDKITLVALKKSIRHWEENVATKTIGKIKIGPENCALCGLFFAVGCDGCPVSARTGGIRCVDTPYARFSELLHDLRFESRALPTPQNICEAMQAELDFLKTLRPEDAK